MHIKFIIILIAFGTALGGGQNDCKTKSLTAKQLDFLKDAGKVHNGIFFGVALNGTHDEYLKNCNIYIKSMEQTQLIYENYLSNCYTTEQLTESKNLIESMSKFCVFDQETKYGKYFVKV